MVKGKERRKYPRYETLFPASLLLEGGKQAEGEVLNVSKRGMLVMLPPKFPCREGMLAEATMHLEVADIPGATFDLCSMGKIARMETIQSHPVAGLYFPRDLNLFFDARVRRPFAVLEKKMSLATQATILELCGDVRIRQLHKLESNLNQLIERHGRHIILDMTRVTFLASGAIDLIKGLQETSLEQGGFLKAVRPHIRLSGSMVSDDLGKLAEFRRALYPTLYHAVMS